LNAQRRPAAGAPVRSNASIVQMVDRPSVGNAGPPAFAATRPGRGQKIDPDSAPVVSDSQYLDRRQPR
jgi:hypothetical protein